MVGQLPVNPAEFNKLTQKVELLETMVGAIKLHNEYLEKTNNDLKIALLEAQEAATTAQNTANEAVNRANNAQNTAIAILFKL